MLKRGMAIYEPKGRAGEYAPMAINLYIGCGHGCTYCYAPDLSKTERQKFLNPIPRPGIIERLENELPKAAEQYHFPDRRVLLCFTSDPYQPIEKEYELTRNTISMLHFYRFDVNILTKAGNLVERDFDILRPGDQFATTLTFISNSDSLKWEPNAALPLERIKNLVSANNLGIFTWVSLEPVIDPEQTLELIRQTHTFVDLYKVGKLNYNPLERRINWHRFYLNVTGLLNDLRCNYYIKEDLRSYARQG